MSPPRQGLHHTENWKAAHRSPEYAPSLRTHCLQLLRMQADSANVAQVRSGSGRTCDTRSNPTPWPPAAFAPTRAPPDALGDVMALGSPSRTPASGQGVEGLFEVPYVEPLPGGRATAIALAASRGGHRCRSSGCTA